MKRIDLLVIIFTIALAVVLLPLPAHAQGADVFKSKCAICHGADGTGSAIGKKMGVRDLTSPEVQKQTDAELTATITNGKDKMPEFGDKLTAEEIKSVVAYIRTLKK
jgi:mono/diheme cytochrome c family protein